MGYVTKDIARIGEPKIFSTSETPNFITFESLTGDKEFLEVDIEVVANATTNPEVTWLLISDMFGNKREIIGTSSRDKVDDNTFYLSDNPAENIRKTLLNDGWLASNFEITIPMVSVDGKLQNGRTLNIKSKGAGEGYNIDIDTRDGPGDYAYSFRWITRSSYNNDSISGGAPTAEIELDIYKDPESDPPDTPGSLGTYVLSTSKTYAGVPVWFELNSMFSNFSGRRFPPAIPGWFDPGTYSRYRFIAKIKGNDTFPFYYSDIMYVINGKAESLREYIYGNQFKLLTNKPVTPYVRGQKEYINFIFNGAVNHTVKVIYSAYSTSNALLGVLYGHEIESDQLHTLNTCALDIDRVLDEYPLTGIIRVALSAGGSAVSNELEYTILPECLHRLRQFSFVNQLGGWDSFNFDAGVKSDIKSNPETYNRAITPYYEKGDSPEEMYKIALDETHTVEGAPVSNDVAEWLRELAVSRTVLDGEGNYVIIEEFALSVSPDEFNMQKPTLKYRYE